jgi:hypothetical protein
LAVCLKFCLLSLGANHTLASHTQLVPVTPSHQDPGCSLWGSPSLAPSWNMCLQPENAPLETDRICDTAGFLAPHTEGRHLTSPCDPMVRPSSLYWRESGGDLSGPVAIAGSRAEEGRVRVWPDGGGAPALAVTQGLVEHLCVFVGWGASMRSQLG